METRLGRQVVIKVLPPEMGAGVNAERFEREIRLAAQLQHPHIVPLLTAGASGDLLYYVMPYIAGESLRVKLAREGELPVAEAVRILREVVDALAYAHRRGVVHRDIKPDNVLLCEGHAVVTDFGVAKALAVGQHAEGARTLRGPSGITSLGVALGTPAYMAPEQAAADPHVDHRADLYAVGTLAYEMLAGRVPFEAPIPQAMLAAHLTATPDPVTQHRRSVPPALNAVIMRCLEKRAADRWQSAGEVASQLDAIATPSGGMAPSSAALPPVAVSSGTEAAIRRGHPVRVAALFAGAAAGVLGAVYLLVQQLGLPDWVFLGAAVLLLVGLPVMLLTGHLERRRAEARASGRAQPTPTGTLHRFLTWRKALMGGALAFAALGLVTTGYTAMRLLGVGPVGTLVAAGRLAQRDKLIVADFENRTADQTLGASVTEAFRIDLSQSPMVAVVPTAAVVEALGRMQRPAGTGLTPVLAREVAVREGAKAVVAGEISGVGRGFVLAVRLLDAGDGTELVALRETAEDDGVIVPAIDRLSGRLRERIGESLRTIRAGDAADRTPLTAAGSGIAYPPRTAHGAVAASSPWRTRTKSLGARAGRRQSRPRSLPLRWAHHAASSDPFRATRPARGWRRDGLRPGPAGVAAGDDHRDPGTGEARPECRTRPARGGLACGVRQGQVAGLLPCPHLAHRSQRGMVRGSLRLACGHRRIHEA